MKKINIFYWISTVLLSLPLLAGSIAELISHEAGEPVYALGYPSYLVPFLSIARILALSVIIFLKAPRLKEWAYAGLSFDLTGALYSHIAHGDPVSKWIGVLVPMILLASSYLLYHKRVSES